MTSSTTVRRTTAGDDGRRATSDRVKTYRYLRIAMVMLLVGIAVSVALEHRAVGDCWQRSISAYYYTPARAFFVSAVLALGVCMVALRGTTTEEEIALNLAGLLAPVVALVPTPAVGACSSDRSLGQADPGAVANNVGALLLIAPACVLYVAVLAWLGNRRGKALSQRVPAVVVLPVVALWAVAVALFLRDRPWFLAHGHIASAVLMFVCIVAVVVFNALGLARKSGGSGGGAPAVSEYANRYSAIAVAMVVSFVALPSAGRVFDWHHWVFAVEAVLLALFLVFWTLQTEELWDEAVREGDPRAVR